MLPDHPRDSNLCLGRGRGVGQDARTNLPVLHMGEVDQRHPWVLARVLNVESDWCGLK